MLTKYLIIGSSAAGVSAANNLAKIESDAEILLVGAQSVRPYNKCFLVDWLVGDRSLEQLDLALNSQVKFLANTQVLELDVHNRLASISTGQTIKYEKALLAIGVRPWIPSIAGLEQATHVFNFHDLHDTKKIQEFIKKHKSKQIVVIGAGLTGVECADALWRMGLNVSLIDSGSRLLGKLVDEAGGAFLAQKIQNCNVGLHFNSQVGLITSNQVVLDSGLSIAADLVVLATGVRPNSLKIRDGELEYTGSYVAVNSNLQTNLPNLWAAGDLVAVPELLTGELVPSCSWPDAMLQGNLAAFNMAGVPRGLPGLLSIAKSRFFGMDFASLGQIGHNENQINTSRPGSLGDNYQKIVLDGHGLVKGALLIGDISMLPALKRAILTYQAWEPKSAVALDL